MAEEKILQTGYDLLISLRSQEGVQEIYKLCYTYHDKRQVVDSFGNTALIYAIINKYPFDIIWNVIGTGARPDYVNPKTGLSVKVLFKKQKHMYSKEEVRKFYYFYEEQLNLESSYQVVPAGCLDPTEFVVNI